MAHSYRRGLVTWRFQVWIPVGPDICHRGCAYTVLQTVQRHVMYSAAYGTVHYKEPLKSFEIRVGHSPGFGLPSVAILPWLCRKRRKTIFAHSALLVSVRSRSTPLGDRSVDTDTFARVHSNIAVSLQRGCTVRALLCTLANVSVSTLLSPSGPHPVSEWQTQVISYKLFRTNEIIFRANEIIFRTNEILFRKNEIIFRTNEIIFRTNEIIFRTIEITR